MRRLENKMAVVGPLWHSGGSTSWAWRQSVVQHKNMTRGRILIVDDEANARAALSEILRDEGYATETAADGFKALGKLEEFTPDVILTDLKMPGLDGIAFMEKAKAASPGAVFVVMTAFGTINSAVDAVKKGAENYLTKPLDFDSWFLLDYQKVHAVLEPTSPLYPHPIFPKPHIKHLTQE